jgi:hypothetical protein
LDQSKAIWAHLQWPEQSIYNIYDIPNYKLEIDFNQPRFSQDKLVQITEAVERECPVGVHFNQKGLGEGVVWTEWTQSFGVPTFKVKGKEHSVTKGREIEGVTAERFASLDDFIEYACTENRMQQSLDYLREIQLIIEIKNIETFLEWLVADIMNEETNTINNSNLNKKDVLSEIINKGKAWFEEQLSKDIVQ